MNRNNTFSFQPIYLSKTEAGLPSNQHISSRWRMSRAPVGSQCQGRSTFRTQCPFIMILLLEPCPLFKFLSVDLLFFDTNLIKMAPFIFDFQASHWDCLPSRVTHWIGFYKKWSKHRKRLISGKIVQGSALRKLYNHPFFNLGMLTYFLKSRLSAFFAG